MSKLALVVTTYNNPRTLGICLRSLALQTDRDFDLFVADDGSLPETRVKIEGFRGAFGGRLTHVWHPDEGYRKSEINNEVFRRLAGHDVVICVDHDTVAHPRFVADHRGAHAGNPRAVFMGRRLDLGPRLSAQVTEENVRELASGLSGRLLGSWLSGDTHGVLRAVRIGSGPVRRFLGRDEVPDLLGSNFSVSRALLYEVNGYNEEYRSYWGEDGDLFVRLRNAGAQLLGSKALAIQFHLHHPRLEPTPEHMRRYRELLPRRDYVRCARGIERE